MSVIQLYFLDITIYNSLLFSQGKPAVEIHIHARRWEAVHQMSHFTATSQRFNTIEAENSINVGCYNSLSRHIRGRINSNTKAFKRHKKRRRIEETARDLKQLPHTSL